MAAWDKSGIATRETFCAVLKDFRKNGIQGIESAQQLTEWLASLTTGAIKEMCEIDKEATLQMLVDCFGVGIAFQKYINTAPEICKQALENRGYIILIKAEIENEMAEKRQRIEQLEADNAKLMDISVERSERVETLKKENENLKIALFDAYEEAGKIKLPGREKSRELSYIKREILQPEKEGRN